MAETPMTPEQIAELQRIKNEEAEKAMAEAEAAAGN